MLCRISLQAKALDKPNRMCGSHHTQEGDIKGELRVF